MYEAKLVTGGRLLPNQARHKKGGELLFEDDDDGKRGTSLSCHVNRFLLLYRLSNYVRTAERAVKTY